MSNISFQAKPYSINSWTVLRLPKEASAKLPSRGQAMVEGTINGVSIKTPLEPDGNFSHWFRLNDKLIKSADAKVGSTVKLQLSVVKEWPDPLVPADIKKAIDNHKEASAMWEKITPMARWEWVRWIRSTAREETRKHRIEVACSKMKAGERRPCCWNRNACSELSVSKNGVLLDPA
jgi:hypothetical protein